MQRTARFSWTILIIQVVFLSFLLAFGCLLDAAWALSLYWQFHAVFFVLALMISIPVICCQPYTLPNHLSDSYPSQASLARRQQFLHKATWYRTLSLLTLSLFGVALLGLSNLDINSQKAFHRLYLDIRPGMSASDVEQYLARRFPRGGRFPVPNGYSTDTQLSYFLDELNGDYKLLLAINQGKVVSTDYHDD